MSATVWPTGMCRRRVTVDGNPFSHLVTAARAAMSGTLSAGQLITVLAACAGLVAVFAPLTMRLYRSGR